MGSMSLSMMRTIELVRHMKKHIADQEAVSHAACVILINASAEYGELVATDFIEQNIIFVLMEHLQVMILVSDTLSCNL